MTRMPAAIARSADASGVPSLSPSESTIMTRFTGAGRAFASNSAFATSIPRSIRVPPPATRPSIAVILSPCVNVSACAREAELSNRATPERSLVPSWFTKFFAASFADVIGCSPQTAPLASQSVWLSNTGSVHPSSSSFMLPESSITSMTSIGVVVDVLSFVALSVYVICSAGPASVLSTDFVTLTLFSSSCADNGDGMNAPDMVCTTSRAAVKAVSAAPARYGRMVWVIRL